jgi:hypothetical protein
LQGCSSSDICCRSRSRRGTSSLAIGTDARQGRIPNGSRCARTWAPLVCVEGDGCPCSAANCKGVLGDSSQFAVVGRGSIDFDKEVCHIRK